MTTVNLTWTRVTNPSDDLIHHLSGDGRWAIVPRGFGKFNLFRRIETGAYGKDVGAGSLFFGSLRDCKSIASTGNIHLGLKAASNSEANQIETTIETTLVEVNGAVEAPVRLLAHVRGADLNIRRE